MGSIKKTWSKLHHRPLRSDLTLHELHALLIALGYSRVRITGSHRHYKHPLIKELLTIPGHSDHDLVKPGYLLLVIRQVEAYQLCLKEKGNIK